MHSEAQDAISSFMTAMPLSGGLQADFDTRPAAGDRPLTAIAAENRELSAEVNRLRAERDRWNDTQRRLMDLLGSKSPEKIIHDLRNVLNERELFRTLADME